MPDVLLICLHIGYNSKKENYGKKQLFGISEQLPLMVSKCLYLFIDYMQIQVSIK